MKSWREKKGGRERRPKGSGCKRSRLYILGGGEQVQSEVSPTESGRREPQKKKVEGLCFINRKGK